MKLRERISICNPNDGKEILSILDALLDKIDGKEIKSENDSEAERDAKFAEDYAKELLSRLP